MPHSLTSSLTLTVSAIVLAACATSTAPEAQTGLSGPVTQAAPVRTESVPEAPRTTPAPTISPIPKTVVPASPVGTFASSGDERLDAWRLQFVPKALRAGHRPETIRDMLDGISPKAVFLDPDESPADQAEFSQPVWTYLEKTLSDRRRETGRSRLAEDRALFAELEAAYGVEREILAAIWGMETSYGGFIGTSDGPDVLASMAAGGRRQAFAEGELLALMRIVEGGGARRDQLVAGWAGALGQTQFMPTTYERFAVDWTGDGIKDVWNSRGDALGSAANYLRASGWRSGQPWGIEVSLPQSFDFSLADGEDRRMETWIAKGVMPVTGNTFETGGAGYAELYVPAGGTGPAFLLFPNYEVIKVYNRSDAYAMAVGILSNALRGEQTPVAPWPKDLDRLNKLEIRTLQEALNALGFDAGSVDGIAGRGTRGALQKFQASRDLLADGYPTKQALQEVLAAL